MQSRAHVTVSGFVQGVFFRSFVRSQAKLLDLKGWVRNMDSGQLEAVFEGDKDQIKEMIEYCKQGPPGSRVGDVGVKWEDSTASFTTFEIR